MRTNNVMIVSVLLILAVLFICGSASAFTDYSLRGQDNPMDDRDEFDQMTQDAGPIEEKSIFGSSAGGLIQNDLPAGEGGPSGRKQ